MRSVWQCAVQLKTDLDSVLNAKAVLHLDISALILVTID
jgi:hypothetical protein